MIVLALDTATTSSAVALWRDGRVVAERRRLVTTHSESLLAMIDESFAEAGLQPRQLDGVACGAGPGSFTGLRIGLATAKGLCFALDKPLAMVSTLAAIAARAPDGRVLAVIDALKGEVYAGLFDVVAGQPERAGDEAVIAPERLLAQLGDWQPAVVVGSGALKYPQLVVPGARLLDSDAGPHPADLARLGAARFAAGLADDLATATPAYLRPSEAELVKQRRQP
ncbi:MAG TPA: tRNA (adenosine(37)-N6)-threonylcarbamoyltransferase complex dimerization subunit type 1 TsaB [Polyangia bacterium]|nr:tRNA (adenosine(37)-N6)-threonylcarbamoyltransferase complex dimerization subunit type 1 TsaB [Polyangia bacterium]HWE28279.1 tRNA (adenosine(37)-N6)-threonylcarbamoyltransferase complex dimerization subunit type 1 TsaB [Polyangia bacterium]